MPNNWKTYKLGEMAKLRKDSITPIQFNNEDYIGLEHITQGTFLLDGLGNSSDVASNKYRFLANDILYGKIRPYFKKAYRPKFSGICSTDILVINSLNEDIVSQDYLYQIVKTQFFTERAVETSSGTKMPRADWNSLVNVEFLVPPLPEQRAIASILSALDDKIELNLQMNKTLEEMAMALYKHWFVDFGPFKDGKFVDSELGLIPESWEVKRLDELVTKLGDGLHGTPKYTPNGEYFFVNGNNLSAGRIIIKPETKRVTKDEFNKYRKELNDRTLFVSINGTIGKVARYYGEQIMLGKSACYFNVKEDISISYIKQLISSNYFLEYLNSNYNGSVIKNVSLKSMRDLPIITPTKNLQNDFQDLVSPIESHQNQLYLENHTLIKLRDTLLPKLISGEVRVKDIEKTIAEAI